MRANLRAKSGRLTDGCENYTPPETKFVGVGAGGDMKKVSKMFPECSGVARTARLPFVKFFVLTMNFCSWQKINFQFCRLLMSFLNSLDPDQDQLNVGPDLDPNHSTL